MSKFWIIFKREYAQVVKKKSFLVGLILTPALMAAFTVVPSMLARVQSSTTEHLAVIDMSGEEIGQKFAASLDEYKLPDTDKPYYAVDQIFEPSSTDSARIQQLRDSLNNQINEKNLKYYVVIGPQASLIDSNTFMVTNGSNFRAISRFEHKLSDILSARRLEFSQINLEVDSVLTLTRQLDLTIKDAKGDTIPFEIKYFGALIFVMIMFGMMLGYGQMVMRSVIEEKNSRIMEVLISSVSPFQLMLGKVCGLGAATFTQVSIWYLIGMLIFFFRGALQIDPAIERIVFDPFIIGSFVAFMVAGYLLYSTLFALIGSVVNNEKEAQSFVMPITLSLILPVMMGVYLVQEPNATVAKVLSLIPIFTPTMMMMRVIFVAPTMTDYSLFSGLLGEAVLGFIILSLSVVALIWVAAKIFRIGILMYGKRPTLPEIIKWVKY